MSSPASAKSVTVTNPNPQGRTLTRMEGSVFRKLHLGTAGEQGQPGERPDRVELSGPELESWREVLVQAEREGHVKCQWS